MIFNTTNQYQLKIRVTMIPNSTNKDQLSGSMLVRGKSMEARQQQLMNDYWNDLSNDLHGVTKEGNESNLAMLWGSINEDSALVTYLKSFLGEKNR